MKMKENLHLQRGEIKIVMPIGRAISIEMVYEGRYDDGEAFLLHGVSASTINSWRFRELSVENWIIVVNYKKASLRVYYEGSQEFQKNCPLVEKLKEEFL